MKVILFGGNGFLGLGLLKILSKNNIDYKSIDINDYDLSDSNNIDKCVDDLRNITHIVILASKIGAKLFNTNAKYAAEQNIKIHNVLFTSILLASLKYNVKYDVTFYSTSEVYGNSSDISRIISDNTAYSFNILTSRQSYSTIKHDAELLLTNLKDNNIISNLKIIRPFNIYGMNLKRGVVYDMIYSALTTNTIMYTKDTTRTMTNIDIANLLAFNTILKQKDVKINLADDRCSLSMKTLANIINTALNMNCNIIELPSDNIVLYRHVSTPDVNIDNIYNIMCKYIIELADQIRSTL